MCFYHFGRKGAQFLSCAPPPIQTEPRTTSLQVCSVSRLWGCTWGLLGAVGLSVNLQESPSTSVHFCPHLLSSLPLLDCAGERRPFLCSRAASHPLWTWAGKGPFCHVKASHWGRPPLWFCYATPATGGSPLAYVRVPSGRLGLGQLTGTEVASWP